MSKKATSEGRVKASTLPAGRIAETWHYGRYHELPKSHNRLEKWFKDKGLTSAGGHWAVYWTDPGMEPDASKWRTQILWPVK